MAPVQVHVQLAKLPGKRRPSRCRAVAKVTEEGNPPETTADLFPARSAAAAALGPRSRSDYGQAGTGYTWVRFLLKAGLLLGLLLLGQSIFTYYQVTRTLVENELRKEAARYVAVIEREGRRAGIQSPADLGPAVEEILHEAADRIAWVKILEGLNGPVLVSSGDSTGEDSGAAQSVQPADGPTQVRRFQRHAARQVMVIVLPIGATKSLHLRKGGRSTGSTAGAAMSSHFVEVALYSDGVNGGFGGLRTNLAVSSAAALGLVASVMLLWFHHPQYVRGQQLERQTELARGVQTDLLPAADALFPGIDFAAACVPSQQVGGDFYDVFAARDGGIAIVVGDVSGKGLPASVVAGLMVGAVRASGWTQGRSQHQASSFALNELLRSRTAPERFASMFWGYYEPDSHMFWYINAGHLPPLLVRRTRGGQLETHHLKDGGPVLGLLQSATYAQGGSAVLPGDLLVLFSDGVIEATSTSGEHFEEDRLLAVIRQNFDRSSVIIREEILESVLGFIGKEMVQDDLTLVVMRFIGSPAGQSADVGV